MWQVAICSNMRAGSDYEVAYYLQILALKRQSFRIASVNVIYDREPDDTRWVRDLLTAHGIPVRYEIETRSGAGTFIDLRAKFEQWASIGNQGIALALSTKDPLTHIAAIEADLSYPFDVFEILLAHRKSIIAPMIYLGNTFYDSWGFRQMNGEKIFNIEPVLPRPNQSPLELSSVGSFVVFDANVFTSGLRYRGDDCEHGLLVGLCEDARAKGFTTFLDPTVSVLHSVTAWRQQLWYLKHLKILLEDAVVHDAAVTDDLILAGPHEAVVRPILDPQLDRLFGTDARRLYQLSVDAQTRSVSVVVNVARA